MERRYYSFIATVFMLAFLPVGVVAEDADQPINTIPDTISLTYALGLVDSEHPEMQQAQAEIELAEAEQYDAQALTGTRVSIDARLRYIEPNSFALDQSNDDHSVGLFVEKNLYDFGYSRAAEKAAASAIRGEQLNLTSVRNQRRLEIMRRYFDVILADLEYLRDNEDMATAFVTFDKASDRREVGQISDIEVLDLKNRYEQVRLRRYRSDSLQRSARARLSIAMNRPGQLADTLTNPILPSLIRKLPEFEDLKQEAEKNNPALLAARARLDAALARLNAARSSDNPVISGEFEASENSRDIGSRDDLRVGLRLRIPLSTGGTTKARIAKQRAGLRQARAAYAIQLRRLEQAVLETWLELTNLRAQNDQARAQLDYSELFLDRSRALYELEVKADLGDAMVQISEAQRYMKETEFTTALTWARLDALLGRTVYTEIATPLVEDKK